MSRRLVASIAFAVTISGCSPGASSAADAPLSLTVAEATIPAGTAVRVTVTNQGEAPVSIYYSGCRYHVLTYQVQIGSSWSDRVAPDTFGCQPAGTTVALARDSSLHYAWTAPADTGTYRVTMSLVGYTLVSPPVVVR